MKTAVEWLGKELESFGDPQFCEVKWEELDSLIQQAKEMEKEQIEEAFAMGNDDISSEQYYNETFKSE